MLNFNTLSSKSLIFLSAGPFVLSNTTPNMAENVFAFLYWNSSGAYLFGQDMVLAILS
jgi:hypothetical protein